MTVCCDLHVHSNCSDGSCSPEQLVVLARETGLSAIALCDHNTTAGLPRFLAAAAGTALAAVAGVEVTCGFEGKEVHVLGLFLPPDKFGETAEFLTEINTRKLDSNARLLKALGAAGYAITAENVQAFAGDAIPNRVHFAKALVQIGAVDSVKAAFDTLLSESCGYYRSAEKLDALAVVAFLRSVGALPVMAHPLLNLTDEELHRFLPRAKEYGLVGLECYYSLFITQQTKQALKLASDYGLLVSGGSDFHGTSRADIALGCGLGDLVVPMAVYETLRAAAE